MSSQAPPELVVVDVGNSGAKIGLVRDEEVRGPYRVADDDARAVADAARPLTGDRHVPIAVCGSDPPAVARLVEDLDHLWVASVVSVGADWPGLPAARVRRPDRAGVDRRTQVLAAVTLARGPAAVVSCGTAITVDLGDVDGALVGGAILPGIGLGSRALAEGTASLPRIELEGAVVMPATDTEAAIRAGLRIGAAGAIERLLAEAGADRGPVFLTGQDAAYVADLLEPSMRRHDGLGMYGVAIAIRRAWPLRRRRV